MANGDYTAEEALQSDVAFKQYVVVRIERINNKLEEQDSWSRRHEEWHKTLFKVTIGAPAFLLALFAVFKLAVRSTGVLP